MYDPVAYTYEADHHCEACAERRFGRGQECGEVACAEEKTGVCGTYREDREGNEVGPVMLWQQWWQDSSHCNVLGCSDCHAELDRFHKDRCTEDDGDEECDLAEYDAREGVG